MDDRIPASSDEHAEHPASAFPAAGEKVGEGEREEALDAMPDGNATSADMVDTDEVDSAADEPADEPAERG